MHRAAFTNELAPEVFEDRFDCDQNAKERICSLGIVRMMCHICIQAHRIGNLDLYRPDLYSQPHPPQRIHHDLVKLGDSPGLERDGFGYTRGGLDYELMVHKIEYHCECPVPIPQQRRCKSASS